jgi:hypothetical protein
MAVYAIDQHRFIPADFDIVDGGEDRLPRTYHTPAIPPPRVHEQYMVAIMEPPPGTPCWSSSAAGVQFSHPNHACSGYLRPDLVSRGWPV